eukprot:356045-Chlamydomonas_euryale.AAC.3
MLARCLRWRPAGASSPQGKISRTALAENSCLVAVRVGHLHVTLLHRSDHHGPCVLVVVALTTCDALARSTMGFVMDVAAEACAFLRRAVAAAETAQAGSPSVTLEVTSIA